MSLFAYFSSYLQIKTYAWKKDCQILSKFQYCNVDQYHFRKHLKISTRFMGRGYP